jgi:hypothetical protein
MRDKTFIAPFHVRDQTQADAFLALVDGFPSEERGANLRPIRSA